MIAQKYKMFVQISSVRDILIARQFSNVNVKLTELMVGKTMGQNEWKKGEVCLRN
jgi:hypothetical protein